MVLKGSVIVLCLLSVIPSFAQEDSTHGDLQQEYPSEELLEFLADFGALDNETYELIEFHALQDAQKPSPEPSAEKEDDQ